MIKWIHSRVTRMMLFQSFSPISLWPVDCSTPGFPVRHQLLEFAQSRVYRVGDTIQPSHPLLTPSPPAFNLCQPSGSFPGIWLFASGGQSIEASASASVLPMNIQDSFPLGFTVLISLQSKGLSRVFSNTTVWKHQFFSAQPSLWFNSHICTGLLEKPELDYMDLCQQSDVSAF